MKIAIATLASAIMTFSALGAQGNIPELPLVELPNSSIRPANPMKNYTPTSVTENQMNQMWNNMTTSLKDKDCFRRAQIWSWDMFDFYNVKSMKVFIHYTNKFNRELDDTANESKKGLKDILDSRLMKLLSYNKTWDFHVAPLIQLTNGDYRVMDKSLILAYDAEYPYTDNEAWNLTKRPATIEEWTEGLMIRGELLWKAKKAMIERDMNETSVGSSRYNELKAKYVELGMDKNETIDIKCHRAESIAEVDLNHKTAYCFYTVYPMYYYTESDLRFFAFGKTNQPYNKPVSPDTYTEANYIQGSENYIQKRWNYSELSDAKGEFKMFSAGDYGKRIKRARQ